MVGISERWEEVTYGGSWRLRMRRDKAGGWYTGVGSQGSEQRVTELPGPVFGGGFVPGTKDGERRWGFQNIL